MKVKVVHEYVVELSDSEFEDFVPMIEEVYEEEDLDVHVDVDGPIEHAIADYIVLESQVGNYNKYIKESNVTYETLEY